MAAIKASSSLLRVARSDWVRLSNHIHTFQQCFWWMKPGCHPPVLQAGSQKALPMKEQDWNRNLHHTAHLLTERCNMRQRDPSTNRFIQKVAHMILKKNKSCISKKYTFWDCARLRQIALGCTELRSLCAGVLQLEKPQNSEFPLCYALLSLW